MSCDEYFSFANLAGSSFETEVGYSTFCVSNQAKAAILIIELILFTVVLFISGFLFLSALWHRRLMSPKIISDGFIFVNAIGK